MCQFRLLSRSIYIYSAVVFFFILYSESFIYPGGSICWCILHTLAIHFFVCNFSCTSRNTKIVYLFYWKTREWEREEEKNRIDPNNWKQTIDFLKSEFYCPINYYFFFHWSTKKKERESTQKNLSIFISIIKSKLSFFFQHFLCLLIRNDSRNSFSPISFGFTIQ